MSTTTAPRLKERYKSEVTALLQKEFNFENTMQIPTLSKIVVMWEFMDRLLSVSLPRIRDFRGLSPKQFDGSGNYTFGLTEQVVFAEIEQDKVDRVRGMDITIVTSAKNDNEGRALLKALGFPFKD